MTWPTRSRQRVAALVVGGSVIVVGAVLAVLALGGSPDDSSDVAAGGSTTTTVEPAPAAPSTPPRPSQAYCGGWGGPGGPEDTTPQGLVVTVSASASSVKRGQEITFTLRAKNTTSEAITHQRGVNSNPIAVVLGEEVVWMRTWGEVSPAVLKTETLHAGEEKVDTVTWKTDQVCDEASGGFKTAAVHPGTYSVEASWNDQGGYWPAEPVRLEIRD